jgi:hypothetical protein
MNDGREDWEQIAEAFGRIAPQSDQVDRWKQAVGGVRADRGRSHSRVRAWSPAVAAGVLGFLLAWGILSTRFGNRGSDREWVADNATPELVITN